MIEEIQAKTILRRYRRVDSWFLARYGFNLYRGCAHNCSYCDGRAEKYRVEGEFGRDIAVKSNAVGLLERELDPARKRNPIPTGFVMPGGGVSDPYQFAEKEYALTRKALTLLQRYGYPVHILTKSILVERDLDLIQKINEQNRAIVSFSFSSTDDRLSRVFEPGVPPPSRRLESIKRFRDAGISCGMYLMPVLPFLTDTPEKIEKTLEDAKEAGIDFVIFGTMTLKIGRQKDHFMNRNLSV